MDHDITINGELKNDGIVISGDINEIPFSTNATIHAGDDKITADDSGDVQTGTYIITGDANKVANGTFFSGNDTITTKDIQGGVSIFGDINEATGGTISFGDDTITVDGNMESAAVVPVNMPRIYGDVDTLQGATVSKWGNDVIKITGNMIQSEIFSDTNSNSASGGNDSVTVDGNVEMNSRIITSGGNDSITVAGNVLDNSVVDAGFGDDTITVRNNVNNAQIISGPGSDMIVIEGNVENNSTITSEGDSIINIDGNVDLNSKIVSGDGATTINVGGEFNGEIELGQISDPAKTVTLGLSFTETHSIRLTDVVNNSKISIDNFNPGDTITYTDTFGSQMINFPAASPTTITTAAGGTIEITFI